MILRRGAQGLGPSPGGSGAVPVAWERFAMAQAAV